MKRASIVGMLALLLAGCGEDSPFSSQEPDLDPGPTGLVLYTDVWLSAPNDVWVIGNGQIHRYNGESWRQETVAGMTSAYRLWGASANQVWVVGGGDEIWFYDGSTWAQQTVPSTGGGFAAIHGASATDVWAVGDNGSAVHWNGSTWTRRGISGSWTEHVWVAGPNDAYCSGVTDFKKWNGSSWMDIRDTADHYQAEGIWGFSANDVWVVGDDEDNIHWDGTTWTVHHFSDDADNLDDVWGAAPNDIWAVGERGHIRRWNGSSWKKVESGTSKYLSGVWGAGGEVWVVGVDTVMRLRE